MIYAKGLFGVHNVFMYIKIHFMYPIAYAIKLNILC